MKPQTIGFLMFVAPTVIAIICFYFKGFLMAKREGKLKTFLLFSLGCVLLLFYIWFGSYLLDSPYREYEKYLNKTKKESEENLKKENILSWNKEEWDKRSIIFRMSDCKIKSPNENLLTEEQKSKVLKVCKEMQEAK